MSLIILPVFGVYIGLIVLWFVAENKWSKRARISLGVVVLVLSLPLPVLVTVGITQLDDNSYYACSIRVLLDETVAALESKEDTFLERLKTFRKNQRLTYETRGDLLEHVRAFQEEGKRIRGEDGEDDG